MWETMHLLSRYNQTHSVKATSANETLVSAYPSVNAAKDSMTVVLINRSPDKSQPVRVELDHFFPVSEKAPVYTLSQLPATETFISHTQNALAKSELSVTGNVLDLSLPAMSVTSVLLRGGGTVTAVEKEAEPFQVFPNPTWEKITVKWRDQDFEKVTITDQSGRQIFEQTLAKAQREIAVTSKLSDGIYFIRLTGVNGRSLVRKVIAH